ncbi:mycofactocin precursor MftA [Phytoactinopolyspora mesophila]|uniref:Mycofactocin n=1 Tax=Phytoactinopolyspora mesophila TaxID=2650750 RepID=A0A7K3M223_9ACTN|nr:mycofactocin precursor MftA [Phytoactinopolyspora mesophila]NDL56478.1 mycofactocin precursor [Phytoactinopolyspora mesophila]
MSGQAKPTTPEHETEPQSLIEADALIEEVSIDGMCGVY